MIDLNQAGQQQSPPVNPEIIMRALGMLAQVPSNLTEAALHYAAHGWPVFPTNIKKKPLTAHGYKDATTDPAKIRAMFRNPRSAGVATPTGTTTGLVVLDRDRKNGVDGVATCEALEADLGVLPPTLQQRTGSGSDQLIFRYPAGATIKNSAGDLGPGLDVRSVGGYIVVPPSRNEAGSYAWLNDLDPAPLPQTWVDFLKERPRPEVERKPAPGIVAMESSAYGRKALEAECQAVASEPQGSRNHRLNQAAFAIGQLVAGGEVQEEEGRPALQQAAAAAGLGEIEADKTIRSGMTAGMTEPRSANSATLQMFEVVPADSGQAGVKPRLRALRRDDLMATPDVDFTVKGVVPSRGLGIVFGLSMVGKSFVMVDMAAHIAEAREWFGCRVKQRPVVYACLEGQHGFKRRVMAWEARHGRRYPDNVIFAPDPIDLRSAQDTTDLLELTLREAGPGAVVIIDTLNRAAPGMEENGSVDYGLILASAGRIEQAVEGFVCFVGHPGKDSTKGIRGHSSMFAGLDMVLEVEEVNKAELSFAWTIRKAKDGQDGVKRHFKREVVELFEDADGDLVTSCVIVPDPDKDQNGKARPVVMTPKDAERFEAFRQAAIEHGTLDDAGQLLGLDPATWRSVFYEQNTDATADTKSKAFRRLKSGLVGSGWIKETLGGFLLPNGPGAEIHAQTIKDAISERTRTAGQYPDKSRTSPVPEPCFTPDGPDTPPIRGVRLSGPVSGANNQKPIPLGQEEKIDPQAHGMWPGEAIHLPEDCAGHPQICPRCVHHIDNECGALTAPF